MLSLWLPFTKAIKADAHVLFCFPYGGGNPAFYNNWEVFLSDHFQVCPVQLPGRGMRFTEPSYTDFRLLIQDITEALIPHLSSNRFSFFGHSMGALVSFEVARSLQRKDLPLPETLFVSGYHAPHLPDPGRKIHDLPDEEFLNGIIEMNGLPEELVENRDYLSVFLPALRADFTMCETYEYLPDQKLKSAIVALGGKEDPEAGEEHLKAWKEQTASDFSLHMLDGDHFYIHQKETEIVKIIENQCKTLYF
ncbi:alpha/beta fold hydrolase [Shimazuella sp. AN120528]|uniref:thioesterase II family protein n=1 Tax=Shimazuella soli TaxID=1892854 RepID=UPI001F0CE1EC|nr:alpha/beta fold hydrolase [Shimazuella soli]MCH5586166.1 alpha/beta fold hydrolase [Shimazuella soli]